MELFLENIKSFGTLSSNNYSFRECPINMNENRKFIVTGDNKNIITLTGDSNSSEYMGTICEKELDKSIEEHIWKIRILKTHYKYIMVGVAPSDFDILSKDQYKTCGWYLYSNGSKLYSGAPFNYSNGLKTNLSKVEDEIVVVMNMKKRTLKFIINNEDKGDSYTNIPVDKPLYPAIGLWTKDDSVEIIDV